MFCTLNTHSHTHIYTHTHSHTHIYTHTHNLTGRGRGGLDAALRSLESAICIIGIDSDILYPAREQEEMAEKIEGGPPILELHMLHSNDGHDGFLLQVQQLESIICAFLAKVVGSSR